MIRQSPECQELILLMGDFLCWLMSGVVNDPRELRSPHAATSCVRFLFLFARLRLRVMFTVGIIRAPPPSLRNEVRKITMEFFSRGF